MYRAAITLSASGDGLVVAGVAGRTIRVLGYLIVAAGAVVVTWKSAAGTSLSGPMSMATASQLGWPLGNALDAPPVLVCNQGEALNLNLSASVQVSGHLIYELACP